MDLVFDPKNKATDELLIFLKIQDCGLRSKVQNRLDLTPQITFWLCIWIPFVRFGQNLAWTYYLTDFFYIFLKIQGGHRRSKIEFRQNFSSKITFWFGKWTPIIQFRHNLAGAYYSTLGTRLRKYFWSISNSKMAAAAAITANYEIGHNLKSIQVRDPILSRPMFSRVRNAMKALYLSGSYNLTGQFNSSFSSKN